MSMRVLFAGTPEMAVPPLKRIAEVCPIAGVLTAPDQEVGRGRTQAPSPVKKEAVQLGFPVFTPEKLDAAFRETVQGLHPDILVVVAYGKIFGPKFLELFPRGGINLHPSLLPRHRGPSPIPAAILSGDTRTGITVQKIDLRMDAGDILLQEMIPLTGEETTQTLTDLCALRGADLLVEALQKLEEGTLTPRPQNEAEATYCKLITKEDGKIQWTLPAVQIERMVRAYDPWPTAWTLFRGELLKILRANVLFNLERDMENPVSMLPSESLPCGKVIGVDKQKGILIQTGEGFLSVTRLQLQSRKALEFNDFLNGVRDFIGTGLGD